MRQFQYLSALFLLLFSLGCDQVIEIDLPDQPSVLVVNATFTPDSVWAARVTASQSIQVVTPVAPVPNAQVLILENGAVIDTLSHVHDDIFMSAAGLKPVAGHTYEIKASAPGYADAIGSNMSPIAVVPAQLAWRDSVNVDQFGAWRGELTITIDDPAGIANYYALSIYQVDTFIDGTDTLTYIGQTYLVAQDPLLEYDLNSGAIFLPDATFDGTRRSIKVLIDNDIHQRTQMFYGFSTVTEAYYRYETTLSDFTSAGINPFVEPVRIYSNMTPGMGIFAGISTSFGLVP